MTLEASPSGKNKAPAAGDAGFEILHGRLLEGFEEFLAAQDLAPAQRAGLAVAPGERLTYPAYVERLAGAKQALHCPDLGMRLAARQWPGVQGPLSTVMRHSPTLGAAIDFAARHAFVHSLAACIWSQTLPNDDTFVGHTILLPGLADRPQAMEQIILLGHLMMRDSVAGFLRPRAICFRHQRISPLTTYRRYFDCPIRFGQPADGVVLSAADLARRMVDADADACRAATDTIARDFSPTQPPLRAEVRRILFDHIEGPSCRLESVAAGLNLNPRTLHRRLAAERTSFQKIKDEVRCDLLREYLERDDLDICAISQALGFSAQSVLTRRCQDWFGVTPLRMRGRLLGRRAEASSN